MTPPDATAPARTARPSRGGTHRRAGSRPSRRVSGPAGGARAARTPLPVGAGAGTVAAPPLALRLARAGARIGDARLLDRLVRGRGWIALVAAGLLGIVFMQVSMLRLNAGISRAVTSAETLERQNSMLRGDISKLDAGDRIAETAVAQGMVRPPAGDVNYLDARKADGRAAAKAIRRPQPVKVAPQAAAAQAPAATTAQTAAQAPAPAATTAPALSQSQAATTPVPATAQAPAQTTQAPTQTTQAQTTAPATTAPAPAPAPATQPPAQIQAQAPAPTAGAATAAQGAQ